MSKQTHTPGPWTVDANGIITGGEHNATTIGEVSASDWHDSVEYARQKGDNATMLWAIDCRARAEANAHLIVSAPELLTAVKALRAIIHDDLTHGRQHDHAEAIDAADAAIARAEGR